MHPAEAFHGDLGMVTANDMVLAISNSGESNEIVNILPIIKRIGAKIIAMSGRRTSTLGKYADYYIDISVEREACPLGLAPTTSTTATLAMGDAITIAAMTSRNFTAQDFAVFHPGGALGRRLLLKVENVMHSGDDNPVISVHKTAKEALFLMTAKGLGATSVVDETGKFIGLVTDGDIRRMLAKGAEFLNEPVEDLMTKNPVVITKDKMAAEALSIMENISRNRLRYCRSLIKKRTNRWELFILPIYCVREWFNCDTVKTLFARSESQDDYTRCGRRADGRLRLRGSGR